MKVLIVTSNEPVMLEQGIVDRTFDKPGTVVKVGETPESSGTEIPGVVALRLTEHLDPGYAELGYLNFELKVQVYVSSMLPMNVKPVDPETLENPWLLLVIHGNTSRDTDFGLAEFSKDLESRYSNPDIALLTQMVHKLTLELDGNNLNTATLHGICKLRYGMPPYPTGVPMVPEEEAKSWVTKDKS